MEVFGFYVHPVVLLVGVVVLAALITWRPQRRPGTVTPNTSGPESETGIVVPPTLPKVFGPYGLGFIFSLSLGFAFTLGTYLLLILVFPNAYASGSIARWVAFSVLASLGTMLWVAIFVRGFGAPPIPVGFAGVPIFFKARPWPWFRFLLPEGVQWGVPYLLEYARADMRARPLIIDKRDPENESIIIDALAKVIPPDVTTPADKKPSETVKNLNKVFEVPVQVHVAARVRTFNPFRRLNFENPDGLLLSTLRERVREFVRGEKDDNKDAFDLPDLKEEMTDHLNEQLEKAGEPMGTNFVKLFVTKITLPESLAAEGENLLKELIQRGKEKYQAETLGQTTEILKRLYPDLSDKELKNMVLTAARLATTTAYSFEGEGKGPLPVIPLGNDHGNNGDNDNHGKTDNHH